VNAHITSMKILFSMLRKLCCPSTKNKSGRKSNVRWHSKAAGKTDDMSSWGEWSFKNADLVLVEGPESLAWAHRVYPCSSSNNREASP
jgi:hypothetical protein